jgi:hypothetical protein
MNLQKDMVDQFDKIIVTIIGEKIFILNGHKLSHESKKDHFCVLMQRLFWSFEKFEEHFNLCCRRILGI